MPSLASLLLLIIVIVCSVAPIEGGFAGKFRSQWIRGGSNTSPHQQEDSLKANIANFYDKVSFTPRLQGWLNVYEFLDDWSLA
jgi:hypothetical protein